ncbi:hypothetical protein K458DRAFT_403751 [Lentithecium fluviatile CBS 122367]|uniref:Uncharacterized protein n=1 Tax=Lentithecium fluviatile CBS 122367 TaxID=1168545 RepID=A0A6G1J3J6_9PLEO|nr:hypothetical protein K458DRAFT_403751 [Lentithecium fluviatile CBS 122367]
MCCPVVVQSGDSPAGHQNLIMGNLSLVHKLISGLLIAQSPVRVREKRMGLHEIQTELAPATQMLSTRDKPYHWTARRPNLKLVMQNPTPSTPLVPLTEQSRAKTAIPSLVHVAPSPLPAVFGRLCGELFVRPATIAAMKMTKETRPRGSPEARVQSEQSV